MRRLKNLPRNEKGELLRTFRANKNDYLIRSPDEAFSIIRLNEFQKWSLIVQSQHDPQGQYNVWNKAVKLADKAANGIGFSELSAFLFSQRENVLKLSSRKYDASLYLCTLFIVRPDEDLTKWSQEDAEQKISDWNEAGYSPFDFFQLAASSAPELTAMYRKILQVTSQKEILESLETT